jgi:tetraacyldisaccharide 4'-kinase
MSVLKEYASKVITCQDKGMKIKITLFPFYLLSLLYQWGVNVRIFLYDQGIFRKERIPCSVISVGNLTVGGTGKTPTVEYIAQFLKEKGRRPVILTRGYKRKSKDKIQMLSPQEGLRSGCEEVGDEPLFLFKKLLTVPVVVGKDRVCSGRLALKEFSPDALLLDDGFQYLKMERDLNIVIVDVQSGFGNGYLLPRGILREPLKGLARADLILLNKGSSPDDYLRLEKEVRRWNATAPIFYSRYRTVALSGLREGEKYPLEFLKGKKVTALCGIANPQYFHFLITNLGAVITSKISFPDHQYYSLRDLLLIKEESQGGELIVTTEKDGVKLKQKIFENLPLFMLEVALEVTREGEFQEYLLRVVTQKSNTSR